MHFSHMSAWPIPLKNQLNSFIDVLLLFILNTVQSFQFERNKVIVESNAEVGVPRNCGRQVPLKCHWISSRQKTVSFVVTPFWTSDHTFIYLVWSAQLFLGLFCFLCPLPFIVCIFPLSNCHQQHFNYSPCNFFIECSRMKL